MNYINSKDINEMIKIMAISKSTKTILNGKESFKNEFNNKDNKKKEDNFLYVMKEIYENKK